MPGRALRYFRRCPWQRPPRPYTRSTRPRKASGFLAALRGIYLVLGMPALPGARNRLAGAPVGSDNRVSTAKPAVFRRVPQGKQARTGGLAHGGSYVNDCQQELRLLVAARVAPMQIGRPGFPGGAEPQRWPFGARRAAAALALLPGHA